MGMVIIRISMGNRFITMVIIKGIITMMKYRQSCLNGVTNTDRGGHASLRMKAKTKILDLTQDLIMFVIITRVKIQTLCAV